MATITRPSGSLPDPGDDLDAEPIRDYINNIVTFLESTNIDKSNVDSSSSDGIMVMDTAQTTVAMKTFENIQAAAGGIREVIHLGLDPAS